MRWTRPETRPGPSGFATRWTACGIACEELEDGLIVEGRGGDPVPGGATIAARLDHRIAMSFAVLGLVARAGITIDDARPIATSFPTFVAMMTGLGCEQRPATDH